MVANISKILLPSYSRVEQYKKSSALTALTLKIKALLSFEMSGSLDQVTWCHPDPEVVGYNIEASHVYAVISM